MRSTGQRLAGTRLELDEELLAGFPVRYRNLAYLQSKAGFSIATGLSGTKGPAIETLYAEGAAWLGGSETAGVPL